ncbi:RluA family pseudouridine synthase [Enterococcus timonensis]|uniref:RluA family pseudouridine synthase n=1 Tax=Enterococcus timonensis TaxID=1852364 RepID=UPI0008D962DA|nr:RluA family pseudouridine synthase [Enterococcus timonensis]
MEFLYQVGDKHPKYLREFLKGQGISKKLLAKIKFQDGKILVNHQEQTVRYLISAGDKIVVHIPAELLHETVAACPKDFPILFEDEHFLIVDKPAGVASIPAQYHPNETMANRVKYYYVSQNYENQVIHIVTRLDRDTSGVMLFAKHGFAHALLESGPKISKKYLAIVSGDLKKIADHGEIDAPIARVPSSLMKRQVDPSGKQARTEYWLRQKNQASCEVEVQLHTGRTHQIRVHFAYLGCPLFGDDLYDGPTEKISRQALHCTKITFYHPFLKKEMTITSPIPEDIRALEEDLFERRE